ncbi:MAG: LPS export ABC transporter permease LptG, partial [Gammaproteobacteria bacterium]
MKRMDIYLARTVVVNVLLVLLVLTMLAAIIGFVSEIHTTYNHEHYGLWDAAVYTVMKIPGGMYDMFTVAVLLGALLGLGELASHNELTVLRAAGVSAARLGGAALCGGLLLAVTCVLIGEFVAPVAEQRAEDRRAELVEARVNPLGVGGVWAKDNGAYVNVHAVTARDTVRGVYIYNVNDQRQVTNIIFAGTGKFAGYDSSLGNVHGTALLPDGQGSVIYNRVSWPWKTLLSPELVSLFALDTDSLSARGLYHYMGYMRDNHLDDRRYATAFWGRIAKPMGLLAMLLLAMPFVFGPLRSSSTGQRMLIGMLIGIGFYVFNSIFMQAGIVFGLNPLISAWLPTL